MKTKATIKVKCPFCQGSGMRELGRRLTHTAMLLREHDGLNGAELAKLAGCGGMAMCNRLVVLQRLGLASSYKWGRERIWTAT